MFLGEPPNALLRGMEIGNTIMREAKAAVRPGVPAGDTHALMQRRLREMAGEPAQRNSRTAYSIAIAFAPDWGEGCILSMTQGEPRPLEAGMTFHLLAGHVFLTGIEQVKRSCCSDTILVTEDCCEILTRGVEHKGYVKEGRAQSLREDLRPALSYVSSPGRAALKQKKEVSNAQDSN